MDLSIYIYYLEGYMKIFMDPMYGKSDEAYFNQDTKEKYNPPLKTILRIPHRTYTYLRIRYRTFDNQYISNCLFYEGKDIGVLTNYKSALQTILTN